MIESSSYVEELDRLRADTRIQQMARELAEALYRGTLPRDKIAHGPDQPTFEFMSMASDRFRSLGGEPETIGGPARAVLALVLVYLPILAETEA